MKTSHAKSKQMRANAKAVLDYYGLWSLLEILEVNDDRLFAADKGHLQNPQDFGSHGVGRFWDRLMFGLHKSPSQNFHRRLTPKVFQRADMVASGHRNWGNKKGRIGWRQVEEPSMQIVVYPDWTIEIDFDYFNPRRDLRGLFGHIFLEWIPHKFGAPKTDPFVVAGRLRRKGYAVWYYLT